MTIQDKLYEKFQRQHEEYLSELYFEKRHKIIDSSAETVTKANILQYFGDKSRFNDTQAQWLLEKYTLHDLYSDWKGIYGRLEEANIEPYAVLKTAEGKFIDDYSYIFEEPTNNKAQDDEWRTYKAELQIPGEEYLHLEVFSADNDVEAVEYAYELCETAEEDVELMEVHELDENYDSIREIDFKDFDPSLRRFMDVDLFDFLGNIADKVLIHYRNDWNIDKEFLLKRAESPYPNDKHVAWHVCATSTHQLDERDVYIKDSGAFGYWTDYHQNDPDMFGFFIEITGHENGRVFGNVFEVGDYAKHAEHMWDTALPIDTVTIEYAESWGVNCGLTITVPRKEYDDDRQRLMCDSGDVVSIKMNPLEGKYSMADVLKTERAHRMGMPIGDTREYLKKLETKLFELRGEPLEHMIQLVPKDSDKNPPKAKPAKHVTQSIPAKQAAQDMPDKKPVPTKPQSFEEVMRAAQQKADNFNRQNAQNKGQGAVAKDKDKNNTEIGE